MGRKISRKISRKRRRHIIGKRTLKRGGNPFKNAYNRARNMFMYPKINLPPKEAFKPTDDDEDDVWDDSDRPSYDYTEDEEPERHGYVTKEDLENLNNKKNNPSGGRRMTRRKRRTKRKSRF